MALDCAAVILAGGESRRMGRAKAWLEFEGRPLLAHLVERLERVFPEVAVVGAAGQELPPTAALRVDDERPGAGPLAGMTAGFKAVSRPFVFVASCDTPFLNTEVALRLLQVCGSREAAVPEWGGRLQPLQATYQRSILPLMERNLAEEQLRVHGLLKQLRTCVVLETELRALDPEGLSFLNMNAPKDYQRALQLWPRR